MSLSEHRQNIAEALGSIPGLQAWPYLPVSLQAPAAVVIPDPLNSFYVQRGIAMGDSTANLVVRLYLSGETQAVTEATDALIVSVCDALDNAGITWSYVRTPGTDSATYQGRAYFCADVTIENIYYKEAI